MTAVAPAPPQPLAVSITPVAADRDARALKIAASLSRLGYTSLLFEGARSRVPQLAYPAAIRALREEPAQLYVGPEAPVGPIHRRSVAHWFDSTVGERVVAPIKYVKFRRDYSRRFELERSVLDGASLCYLHSYEYFAALTAGRGAPCPVIYDAHDFYQGLLSDDTGTVLQKRWILPYLQRLESRCIAGASHIVTVCDGIANEIASRYGRRPTVLRNAHDERLEIRPAECIRERLGLSPADRLLVVVGNNKVGLAFDEVVDAVGALPGSPTLAFVGKGYDTASLPAALRGKVRAFDDLQAREVVPFIRGADLAIVPYKPVSTNSRFALPNGLFQVLAAGLPTLYPALPEVTSLLRDYDVGARVDMRDASGIKEALQGLAEPARQAAARAEACRFSAANSWRREEAGLARIVEELSIGSPTSDD